MIQNQNYIKGASVILTKDLTRYHKSLLKGVKGETVGKATYAYFNSDYNDRFVKVKFPETTIDILWDSLELSL